VNGRARRPFVVTEAIEALADLDPADAAEAVAALSDDYAQALIDQYQAEQHTADLAEAFVRRTWRAIGMSSRLRRIHGLEDHQPDDPEDDDR
jgi:hypothetical protein